MKLPAYSALLLVSTSIASLTSAAAQAQSAPQPSASGQLKEVVVTAERRSQNLQRTAASVTVRKGADLQKQGRYTLGQILEDVPGVSGGAAVSPTPGGSGTDAAAPGLTIRGIPSNVGAVGNVTTAAPAAAVYVDGVYEGVGGSYDIDHVEVLRGPQGTLYGRSATSGLVAIHTTDPNLSHVSADAAVEVGDYSLEHYYGAVNVPIIDHLVAVRVAGNYYQRNGFYGGARGNGYLGSADGKVKLLYQPNSDLSLLLGYALQNNSTGNGGTTVLVNEAAPFNPTSYIFQPTPLGRGSNDFRQYWALLNWDLGFGKLTYEPTFRTWTSDAQTFSRGASPLEDINTTISVPRDHFMTQELRLASDPGSTINWQAGALYYDNSLSSHLNVTLSALGLTAIDALLHNKTTQAAGVFAQATYPLMDTWRLTGGVRYDYTKVSVNEDYTSITGVGAPLNGNAGIRNFDNFTYKVRLEHDLTPQNLIYASVSTGFTPGDVSITTGSTGNPFALELKSETLTAYEAGTKNRFLDNRLQVNGSVYFYDYGAYQSAGINVAPPGDEALSFVTLSAPAQSYGGELETTYQLTPNDRASLNLDYVNAYFTNRNTLIETAAGNSVTFGEFFARKQIPGVTPFTANFGYDHVIPLPSGSSLTLHGDGRYLAGHYLSNVTAADVSDEIYYRVGGEWVGDLGATWASPSGNYSLTGYVRNISDNRYNTLTFLQTASIEATPYDPRTYGVVLSAHF